MNKDFNIEAEKILANSEDTYTSDVVENVKNVNLVPMHEIDGFAVRPGFYDVNGATAIPCGVNFTVHSQGGTSIELILFKRGSKEPFAIIPFPENYRVGKVYSMIVFDLDIGEFEYAYRVDGPYDPSKGLIFNKDKFLLDPYAKAVTGQSVWCGPVGGNHFYKARVVKDNFDWGVSRPPHIDDKDLIIYEMHVRGFTRHGSSDVRCPGTFKGIIEKIPYLLELGVNVVELMPVFEFDEMLDYREFEGNKLYNYWGYNTLAFFAPNTSFSATAEYNREGTELKELIKALHENGIEVYLDVVFNHTAEGDERGPYFSFKGFDNNIYYLLDPSGRYYNFSGCGNALNCNNPIVQNMIIECLHYWVTTYHVDGFRFDLASILGRNEDGTPMSNPPLLKSLAFDPILADTKLIAEAWDAGGLYQVGSFPSWNRWAEWNGRYRDDLRRFIKGDGGVATATANRLAGSHDIYDPKLRENASVNFITCHDGFTLNDLYSYNEKHNAKNGWHSTDGTNDNLSWNCGFEGKTDNPEILRLRRRLMKNAIALLMLSRGTPMFLAGDEFCNSQNGNNNAYCQDNETSWLDWALLEKNQDMFEFFKKMIAFRKKHRLLRANISNGAWKYNDITFFDANKKCEKFEDYERYIGVLFAGSEKNKPPEFIFVAANSYWEKMKVTLPSLPDSMGWFLEITTIEHHIRKKHKHCTSFVIPPRTVCVYLAKLL